MEENSKKTVRSRTVEYKDTIYESQIALAAALNVNYGKLNSLLSKGIKTENAILVLKTGKVTLWKNDYTNLLSVAKHFKCDIGELCEQLNGGISLEDALHGLTQPYPCIYRGQHFPNLVELCTAHHIHPKRITQARDYVKNPVFFEGAKYPSQVSLCDSLNISRHFVALSQRQYNKDFLEMVEILNTFRHNIEMGEEHTLSYFPLCVIHGEPFRTVQEICDAFKINAAEAKKCRAGHSNWIDTLKELQTKTGYLFKTPKNGTWLTSDEVAEWIVADASDYFSLKRKYGPLYPKLLEVDLNSGCYDAFANRKELTGGRLSLNYDNKRSWSLDDIRKSIEKFIGEHQRLPRIEELNTYGDLPNYKAIQRCTGKTPKEYYAEFFPDLSRRTPWTKKMVVEAMVDYVSINGRLPGAHDCRTKNMLPSPQTIKKQLGVPLSELKLDDFISLDSPEPEYDEEQASSFEMAMM